ncbi:MAG: HAD family hydrolase [Methanobacteriota archaeon]|nr:MAG: HAD family hydrolase [Euryarchaeota archaeon]
MIEAVTFDLWHTVIYEPDDNYTQRSRMIRIKDTWRTLKDLGYEISHDEVKVGYHYHNFMLEDVWSEEKDVSERTQIRMLLDCLNIKKGRKELYAPLMISYGEALQKNMPALSDGIEKTLKTLKKRGYSIGMISNTGHTSGRGMKIILDKLGVLKYFDTLTFSNEMRIRKPQTNIFARTLGALDVKPKNSVHVGDDVVNDVFAARKVGMKGILYDKDGRGRMGRKVDGIISSFEELPGVLQDLGGP